MKSSRRVGAFGCIGALALALGCGPSSGDGDGDASAKPSATATTSASARPPSSAVTIDESDKKPGIEVRVKKEIDDRADGISGTALAVKGAQAALQTPKDWTTTKGDITIVSSADKKASLAAGSLGEEKVADVEKALGLSACSWNPSESLKIGKDKIAGGGADGLCSRGDAKIKTAMISAPSEHLLVVVAWESGGDDANLFGALRSMVRAGGGGGGGGLAACCKALEQNAVSAPPDKKGAYTIAIGACKAALGNKDVVAAIRGVQAAAKGINLPADCK